MVKLRASDSFRAHQTGLFEHGEMLRDGLARHPEPVPRRKPAADLEKALPVTRGQLVQDHSPGRIGDRVKDVTHTEQNRQVHTCMSRMAGLDAAIVWP